IRLDGGTAYSGAVITRFYDPLLEKVTAWAPSAEEAVSRMDRALREFRIRGVATNLTFLEAIINHPRFRDGSYTTRFIDSTPELFRQVKRRDRATKLLNYIADVSVNGHPETRGRAMPNADASPPRLPFVDAGPVEGTKQLLDRLGPAEFARWMRGQQAVLVTDTTMRDAHQSLLATRVRTYDIARAAETCARALPQLLSLECWGGATLDVAMRFLTEDPDRQLLDRLGPAEFARGMRGQQAVLVTDTTMRDAHQSLLATRVRTYDIARAAETCARALPQLLSLECWGGATFDVAMRFLTEDPWERLAKVREAAPNILLQMLLRGANGVGYTNYPDNVVRYFVHRAAEGGIDLFRVFDCLNWVENMRVAIDAVCEE